MVDEGASFASSALNYSGFRVFIASTWRFCTGDHTYSSKLKYSYRLPANTAIHWFITNYRIKYVTERHSEIVHSAKVCLVCPGSVVRALCIKSNQYFATVIILRFEHLSSRC